uniref:Serine/threonine-protein kinase 40 n=1 Tax=Phallusia mammillata TaxID=59560 RepID=A0A6F9DUV3_9ASCI|nr:serine/threonine-protein kinase ppk1-like [Phallusia mammillata]
MASQGGDGEQPDSGAANSMEDARRQHLKNLHRRSRFRAKLIGDESNDAPSVANNEHHGSSSQAIHPTLLPQVTHRPFPCPHPVNSPMQYGGYAPPAYPYPRRYSLASYHPLYIQGVPVVASHIPYYYPPHLPQNFYHPVDRGRVGSETSTHVVQNEDVGDDDVFSTSTQPRVPPNLPNDALNTFLHQERRKRARSAGDLGMLYSPGVQNMFGGILPPQSPLQSPFEEKRHFVGMTGCPVAEQKQGSTHNLSSGPQQPPSKRKCTEAMAPSAARNPSVEVQGRQVNPRCETVSEKAGTSDVGHSSNTQPPVTTTPLVLKSSLVTSRSSNVKKKVIWNDLPKEHTVAVHNHEHVEDKNDESFDNLINMDPFVSSTKHKTVKNRIGPYLVGPKLGSCPVKCVSQYLVRKANTCKYYVAKVLKIESNNSEVRSGKMLLHNEHSLLSLLSSHPGVIRQHGLFKDSSYSEAKGTVIPRVGLILDCLTRHEQDSSTSNYLNLQQYVIQSKRLSEREATRIFYLIVSVVYSLHKINVVHRDLKLGNMVLDMRVRKVTLTNFCLGCHLSSESEMLTDQRGSPAYISPDVLSGQPYAGKPSDMWSLGVVLFTMLYGQFPFYDPKPKMLFTKIKHAKFSIPETGQVSLTTNGIIRGLLTLHPDRRMTASEVLAELEAMALSRKPLRALVSQAQVVPDIDDDDHCNSDEIVTSVETAEDRLKHERLLTFAFEQKLLSDDEIDDEGVIV